MNDPLHAFETEKIIDAALAEDLAGGDVTTLATVAADTKQKARLIAKKPGVICGLRVFRQVLHRLDDSIDVRFCCQDGDKVQAGAVLAEIHGPARSILSGERVALNFLQRLSGIATQTRAAVEKVKSTSAKITDTRKTTPGLRSLEKYAVRVGGGYNHRFNLSDGVLIKDNHIRAAGSITAAIERARKFAPHTLKIEVEVESEDQVAEALAAGAHILMLDNMDLVKVKAAASQIAGRALIEISGNMGEKDLAAFAKAGVDLISIGALTHSASSLDISLRFED